MPTIEITAATSPASAEPISAQDKLTGRDILWRNGNFEVSPAGDWVLVDGLDALRQAVIHRLLTSPGEFAFRPEYGVGARDFVKARGTQANIDELRSRIQSQLLQDRRVVSVEDISVEWSGEALKIAVAIRGAGQPERARPFLIATEVA